MPEPATSLFRRGGKCARNHRGISNIHPELVFRGPQEKSAENRNEISSLGAELVFCQIPGQLVQRRRHAQRFDRRIFRRRTVLNPVRGSVVRVSPAPVRLCLPTAGCLALRLSAGALALSDSRVRPKPPPANRARSLPGLWHGELPSSPRRRVRLSGLRSESLGHFWQAGAGQFSRAPKPRSSIPASRSDRPH